MRLRSNALVCRFTITTTKKHFSLVAPSFAYRDASQMPKHSEETPPSPKMEPTLSFPSVKPVPAGTKRKNPVSVTSSEGPTSKKARSPIEGSSGSTFTTPRSTMSPDVKEALVGHLLRVACCAVDKEKLAGEVGGVLDNGEVSRLIACTARHHEEAARQRHLLGQGESEEQADQGSRGSVGGRRS